MKKKLLILSALFLLEVMIGAAQTTTVTAVVVDSDSQSWTNGSWQLQFVPNPSYPSPAVYNVNGASFPQSFSGAMDSGANMSVAPTQNQVITPTGSMWKLTVCPNASAPCGYITFTATGSTMNVTTSLTAAIPAPRFIATANSYGYADVEAIVQPRNSSMYFNVATGALRCFNLGVWNTCNAGGGGSMTWPSNAGLAVYSGTSSWLTSLPITSNNVVPVVISGSWTTSGNPNINIAGNAATATGLFTYPPLCGGGQFSQGLSSGSNNCATPSGGGGGLVTSTNGTNNASQTLLNFQNSTGPGQINFTNPSGGNEQASLVNTSITINGQTINLGAANFANWVLNLPVISTDIAEFTGTAGELSDTGVPLSHMTQTNASTTTGQICRYTTTGGNPVCGPSDFPEVHQVMVAGCDAHSGTATAGTAISLPTTATPTPACRGGTNNLNGVLTFGASESAQFQLEYPIDANPTNLPFIRINYTQALNTASLTISYQIQVACSTTTDDPSFAAAQTFSTTTTGSTANTPYTQTIQLNTTSMTGCVPGNIINFKIATTSSSNASSNLEMITVTYPILPTTQAE